MSLFGGPVLPGDVYSCTRDGDGNVISETHLMCDPSRFRAPVRPFGTAQAAWIGLGLLLFFVLAFGPASCLAGGLLNSVAGRPAPVSAVFLCPVAGTPNFGVAVGYTRRAQAWKADAGSQRTLENPDPGMGSPLKNVVMIAPNSSEGASAPKGTLAAKLAAFQSSVIVASHEQGQRISEVHTLVKLWAVELKLRAASKDVAALEAERKALSKKGGAL